MTCGHPPARARTRIHRLGRRERGSTPIELVLGLAVLLLPAAIIVALLPTWSERQGLAVIAATEAARTVALADDWAAGHAAALEQVARVAANHGSPDAVEQIAISGELVRGGSVTAAVTVRIPLTAVPFVGQTGGWSWTARHTEPVDPYRSFPP